MEHYIYTQTDHNDIDYTSMLGIESPFKLVKSSKDDDAMRIDLHFDYPRGSKFTCPVCGAEHCSPRGNVVKVRRYLDWWEYATFIHLRHPYIKCDVCKNTTVYRAPYEGVPGGSFTKAFEDKVVSLAAGTSYVRVSAQMRISDRCVSDIINRYVDGELAKLDLSQVRRIMIDETGLLGKRGVFTIFTDIDTKMPFCIVRGCGATTVTKMLIECVERGLEPNLVTDITTDFSAAFYKGASDCFPHAQITQDYFHLAKLLNKAIDAEVAKLMPDDGGTKAVKWILRRNPNSFPEIGEKQQTLAQRYKTIGRLLALKQSFLDIFEKRAISDSMELTIALKEWVAWAQHSGFTELKKFAKFVVNHISGIINILRTGLTNAAAEALNTGAKLIKRIARGCRSARNIISRVQLTRLPLGRAQKFQH